MGGVEGSGGDHVVDWSVPAYERPEDGAMIWFREAATAADERFTVALYGCGKAAPVLARAIGEHGTRAQVLEVETELTSTRWDSPAVLLIGSALDDAQRALATAVRSECWDGIVVLSDCRDPRESLWALDGGAHDVICPPHSATAVQFRAAVVHRRIAQARANTVPGSKPFSLDFEPTSRRVRTPVAAVDLSEREYALFERLASARGEVVGRLTLLADIWGADQRSEAVLDATVHRLRRKLEADTAEPRIITTVRGIGYRLERGVVHVPAESGAMLWAS